MRRSIHPVPIVLAAALVLTSCHPDASTDVGANNGTDTTSHGFTLAVGYADSGKMTTDYTIATFPIISLRSSPQANLEGQASPPVNSPFDLTWHGGQLVLARPAAYSRDIYINCGTSAATWASASCWGGGSGIWPGAFLADLPFTSYLGIADQYIGPNLFFVGPELSITGVSLPIPPGFTNPTAFLDHIKGIILSASAAISNASGYSNIFHVFLPPNTDVCQLQSGTVAADTACYSPDHLKTFRFCAFHSSFDDNQGRHFLYTVEPFQFVSGCARPGQRVIDATGNALAHEFFETITDPDVGTGWYNGLFGIEVADMCQGFFDNVVLRRNYVIQEEYSNEVHGCTDGS